MPLRHAFPLAALVAVLVSPMPAEAQRKKQRATVGMVIDGPWYQNDRIADLVEGEITALTKGEFDVRLPKEKRITADWTKAGVRRAVDKLLADKEVDLIITLGVIASDDAAHRTKLSKPVLAPFVIDPQIQGLPQKQGTSGVKNLNYLTTPFSLGRDIQVFRELVPVKRLAMLVNPYFAVAVPGLQKRAQEAAKKLGVKLTIIAVNENVRGSLKQIPKGVDGVYVGPLLHLPLPKFKRLINTLNKRRLPTFSFLGRSEVEAGLLAGIRPFSDWRRVARRLALNVQRVMLGDDPKNFPVTLREGEQLVINLTTARRIRVWPPWSMLTEADIVGEEKRPAERLLTLPDAMRLARKRNPDVLATRPVIARGESDVSRARAKLLPQVELTSQARLIDADRAEASFGSAPEQQWTGDATATQVLWSEPAWAGLTIENHRQDGRRQEFRQAVLDATLDAATAYLNVLRAMALERIQKQNLSVTRENLDLAKTRFRVGNVSRADVLRWESQIANDRAQVIDASAGRNVAEIALNRVLGFPVEDPIRVKPASLRDPELLVSDPRTRAYLKDPYSFRLFRSFVIQDAVKKSPELARIDAGLRAQERFVVSRKRALWAPTVALRGGVTQEFADAGAGAGQAAGPMLPGGVSLPQADETNWFVGVNLSFNLLEGGAKFHNISRESAELSRLRAVREATKLRIQQRVATALHQAGATYAGISLSRQGAKAASENLALVRDAYGNGTVAIQRLLDAQRASLVADQLAANAVYDFLIDYMEVQRAHGEFGVFLSPEKRNEFFDSAKSYVQKAKEAAK